MAENEKNESRTFFWNFVQNAFTLRVFVAISIFWLLANIVGFLSVAGAMEIQVLPQYEKMMHTLIGGLLVAMSKIVDNFFSGGRE